MKNKENTHRPSRKNAGRYMIFMTLISGLLGGLFWYNLNFEVACFTLLLVIIMLLLSIRYNQYLIASL